MSVDTIDIADPGRFVPGTRVIGIGRGVVYRPLRSWHSGVFAGEGLEADPRTGDRSGCVTESHGGLRLTYPPRTYTHRLYWRLDDPSKRVSCFLSYPHAMGCVPTYFWETYIDGEVERFASEVDAEARILEAIGNDEGER